MSEDTLIMQLKKLNNTYGLRRQGKLFYTDTNAYYFDSGTAKVFNVKDKELELLSYMLETSNAMDHIEPLLKNDDYRKALINIFQLAQTEHIMQMPYFNEVKTEKAEEIVDNLKIQHLILELTEKCNLRCKYCIYNDDYEAFRHFSTIDMSWETAKKALDFAYMHSSDEIVIGFYGGEPLLNFDLMKLCIDYCIETFKNKKMLFAFTSNLTRMTPSIAKYLSTVPELQITCSLDGPDNMQNEYRVFADGVGSHEKTIHGLKLLVDELGADRSADIITLHSVLCPPFTKERYDSMSTYFNGLTWLPDTVNHTYSYTASGSLPGYERIIDHTLQGLNSLLNVDPYRYYALEEFIEQKQFHSFAYKLLRNGLSNIHTLEIYNIPKRSLYRNACCIPGKRKVYVTTTGNFKVCERIGETPFIGNIDTGLDVKTLKEKYIQEYDNYALEKCNDCWAVSLCPMCYAFCYGPDGLDTDKKDAFCLDHMSIGVHDLVIYYYLLEHAPEAIDYLDLISVS